MFNLIYCRHLYVATITSSLCRLNNMVVYFPLMVYIQSGLLISAFKVTLRVLIKTTGIPSRARNTQRHWRENELDLTRKTGPVTTGVKVSAGGSDSRSGINLDFSPPRMRAFSHQMIDTCCAGASATIQRLFFNISQS